MTDTTLQTALTRRRLLCGCAGLMAAGVLGACSRSGSAGTALAPVEADAKTSCALDGMLLADYPGPKGQLRYKDSEQTVWFCDATELLSTLIAPEQVRPVAAAWVQDMAQADWERPVGHWIAAQTATFVLGSRKHGSMGPTSPASPTSPTPRPLRPRTAARCWPSPRSRPRTWTCRAACATTAACDAHPPPPAGRRRAGRLRRHGRRRLGAA